LHIIGSNLPGGYYQLSTCLPVDCTTLKHFCIAWGRAEGCTVLLKGGTISMPTGRHVNSDFIPGLKTKTNF
jgi:hypothetical protein